MFLDDTGLDKIMSLADKLDYLDDKIRQITSDENKQKGVITALEPWETALLPLECGGTDRCSFLSGTVPGMTDENALEEALYNAVPESQLNVVSSTENKSISK